MLLYGNMSLFLFWIIIIVISQIWMNWIHKNTTKLVKKIKLNDLQNVRIL